MLQQVVLGLLIVLVGGLIIYYSAKISEFLGRSTWAEEYLGGTKNAVMLFGVFMFIIGGLIMLGVISLTNPANSIPIGLG